jgi:chromosome segregation ATPase
MKKAFDQNVSRAKPRLRLGGSDEEIATDTALADAPSASPDTAAEVLSSQIKERLERARETEPHSVAVVGNGAGTSAEKADGEAPVAKPSRPEANRRSEATPSQGTGASRQRNGSDLSAEARRQRLKERLRAARENPKPEPLPPTVAEAGALAVERIASLQTEVAQLKALNLSLTHDLEGARRNSEKATEEARIRMDEARRLSSEMDARAKLLGELERELGALEGERNEALLALQDARNAIQEGSRDKEVLGQEVAAREKALSESLAEEERLADELEAAQEQAENLRRSLDALSSERNALARQVADLTAERAELLEARRALESVHRALTQASVR